MGSENDGDKGWEALFKIAFGWLFMWHVCYTLVARDTSVAVAAGVLVLAVFIPPPAIGVMFATSLAIRCFDGPVPLLNWIIELARGG